MARVHERPMNPTYGPGDALGASARIGALRERRAREPGWMRSAARAMFDELRAALERDRRRAGGVSDAWDACCPPALLARTRIVSLRRGTLTIGAPDAATKFELDRALRGGAEAALIRASSAPVRAVKIVFDPPR